jgi:ribosomal protein S18 acetylase RimI-like enzyme
MSVSAAGSSNPLGVRFLEAAKSEHMGVIQKQMILEKMNPLFLDPSRFIVAEDEEENLIGFGQVRPAGDTNRFELASLYVMEDHRRRGIGEMIVRKLTQRLANDCASKGTDTFSLFLLTVAGSSAQKIYEKCGFEQISTRDLPLSLQAEAGLGQIVLFFSRGQKLQAMRWTPHEKNYY